MDALVITRQNENKVDILEVALCDPEEAEEVLEYKYYEYLFNVNRITDSCIDKASARICDANGVVYVFTIKEIK